MKFDFLPSLESLSRDDDPVPGVLDEPAFITRLRKRPQDEREFWLAAAAAGTPVLEPLPDSEDVRVTFVVDEVVTGLSRPAVRGAPVFSLEHIDELVPMIKVEGTRTWFLSMRARRGAVITFAFVDLADPSQEVSNPVVDPLCRERYPSTAGSIPPPAGWAIPTVSVVRVPVSVGTRTTRSIDIDVIPTSGFGERRVFVYRPGPSVPVFERGWMLMFDGFAWASSPELADTLDDLIARGAIPPLTVVMFESPVEERNRELSADPAFTAMIAEEVAPSVRERWGLTRDPARTIVAGQSFGGSQAFAVGACYPHVFGNVLSQSGSFWLPDPVTDEPGWFFTSLDKGQDAALRVYLDVGIYEGVQLAVVRGFAAALEGTRHETRLVEYAGGHDLPSWAAHLGEGIRWLTRDWDR